ncbi:MAG: peptide deformylase [Bryobacterales bacterium]|nr:peptide deformylase [Bryobacterales bacterium]
MAVREILLLGNPLLLERCAPLTPADLHDIPALIEDLHDTLFHFRARHGVGRAIAAPQIGALKRVVYMNVGKPLALLNSLLTWLSEETFPLWDDCMSFPDLLVRVNRHVRATLEYRDADWQERTMELEGDLSELLQHELDHLDGILAVSRAIDGSAFALRGQRHLLTGTIVASPETTGRRFPANQPVCSE